MIINDDFISPKLKAQTQSLTYLNVSAILWKTVDDKKESLLTGFYNVILFYKIPSTNVLWMFKPDFCETK